MKRRLLTVLVLPALLAAGCTNLEPYERRIAKLEFDRDAAEQQAEQATVDKERSDHELKLANDNARLLQERLALAYDAVREARARLDTGLHDRLTELSESGKPGGTAYQISQYGGIVLESGIFFASGSHQLTPQGQQALRPLVETLKKPGYAAYEIELAGHTDGDPITRTASRYRDNHDLASLRANSVRIFLVENGVPTDRVHLSAWGPTHPFSTTEKAKNRRVEILLHKQDGETVLPASAPRDGASAPDATAEGS